MITDDKKSILERVNFFCAFFIWSDPTVFKSKIYAEKAQIALFYDNFWDQWTQQMGKVCSKCLKYELFFKTDAWPKFWPVKNMIEYEYKRIW